MTSEKTEAAQAADATDEDSKGNKSQQALVDYLQAPRKKRKSFVVVAVGPSIDGETQQAILRFIKNAYPKFSVATPQNPEEFVRQFSRNIVLAIVDDQFVGLQPTLDLVKMMKQKKNEAPIPVLFLTNAPAQLIDGYRDKLALWHEVDEYIVPSLTPRQYLFAKIKNGVDDRYRRKSRRYKVQFPVTYTVLDSGDRKYKGMLVDLSIHGALLMAEKDHTFSMRDQIMVHMPYGTYVQDADSDILRVAAKVRRIFIAGDRAGVSWEHMSDIKVESLSRLITSIVNAFLGRSAATARAKIAKADAAAQHPHQGGDSD